MFYASDHEIAIFGGKQNQLLQLGLLLRGLNMTGDNTNMFQTVTGFLASHNTSNNVTDTLVPALYEARNLYDRHYFLAGDVDASESVHILHVFLSAVEARSGNQGVFIGIASALMVVTMVSIAARFWARGVRREGWCKSVRESGGWADLCLLLGLVLTTLFAIYGLAAEADGCLTCPIYSQTYASYKSLLKTLYTSDVLYAVSVFLARSCLISLFSSASPGKRYTIFFLNAGNVAVLLVSFCVVAFQCSHPVSFWKAPLDAMCYVHRVATEKVVGCIGVLLDLTLLAIDTNLAVNKGEDGVGRYKPAAAGSSKETRSVSVATVQVTIAPMVAWEKWGMFAAWWVGVLACVTAIVRAVYDQTASSTAAIVDANISLIYIMSLLEVDLILLLTCFPAFSTLIKANP